MLQVTDESSVILKPVLGLSNLVFPLIHISNFWHFI